MNPVQLQCTLKMFRSACECDCLSRKEYFGAAQDYFTLYPSSRAVSFPLAKAIGFCNSPFRGASNGIRRASPYNPRAFPQKSSAKNFKEASPKATQSSQTGFAECVRKAREASIKASRATFYLCFLLYFITHPLTMQIAGMMITNTINQNTMLDVPI